MLIRLMVVMVVAFSATFACGAGVLTDIFPRQGWASAYSDSLNPVLAFADTDEAAQFYDLSRNGFGSYADFVGFADIEFGYPEILLPVHLTEAPHSFDSGDWAFALGLFDESGGLDAYIQMRVAGSSATVSPLVAPSPGFANPPETQGWIATVIAGGLPELAVSSGLWPSTDVYYEFNRGNALVFPIVDRPTGPGGYGGSVFPEPTAGLLAVTALTGLAAGTRRRGC